MSKLISQLDPVEYQLPQLISDLKLVFPLFVEDFIHHIYEEEDELFHYISLLSQVNDQQIHYNKIFSYRETISIEDLADKHENADDEMRGIRRLTANYTLGIKSDIHLKTIYKELKQFERDLAFHAKVENEVLFPMALTLEESVMKQLGSIRNLN